MIDRLYDHKSGRGIKRIEIVRIKRMNIDCINVHFELNDKKAHTVCCYHFLTNLWISQFALCSDTRNPCYTQ